MCRRWNYVITTVRNCCNNSSECYRRGPYRQHGAMYEVRFRYIDFPASGLDDENNPSTVFCKVTGAETQSIPLQVCLFR